MAMRIAERDGRSELWENPPLLLLGDAGHSDDPSGGCQRLLRGHGVLVVVGLNAEFRPRLFLGLFMIFFVGLVYTFCSTALFIVLSPNT